MFGDNPIYTTQPIASAASPAASDNFSHSYLQAVLVRVSGAATLEKVRTYLVTHAAWPHLVASGGGVVLNTGSICSFWAFQDLAAYCATKGAVMMLTKCLALDGAEAGIRANAVCPGDTETPNIIKYYDSFDDPAGARRRAERAYPLDRFARPSEVAAGFVFLASDAAAFITGSHLMVDGGRTSGAWYPQPI